MAVRVLLVDDHRVLREGLRALLEGPEFAVVGEAGDGLTALRLAEKLRPDVVVLDLVMPGLDGLEVARQLPKRSPRSRVVVLSAHATEAYAHEAFAAGACGYVVKDGGIAQVTAAVRAAANGQRYLSAPLTERALGEYAKKLTAAGPDPFAGLTPREREVLQLTAAGLTCADIGGRLYISARTVESHRANLMRKLGVRNQKELVRLAVERWPMAGGRPA
jgi:DNA-binding NarL/FixJ family response regulator